ncbi:MAG: type II toxin-antitoxin system YoeB family toxin [Roseburia sp.]|nr:type II toxin-antitoxin system YoeB family toxin [Roseburia sp.]
MNDLTFTDKGFADYVYWQFQDKKTIKKINNLLDDIKRNGAMQGIGKPEPLKHYSGQYNMGYHYWRQRYSC